MNEILFHGSADVLGRLKAMMLSLRKSLCGSSGLTLQCKMTALEAITALRDEIIGGLMVHFTVHGTLVSKLDAKLRVSVMAL